MKEKELDQPKAAEKTTLTLPAKDNGAEFEADKNELEKSILGEAPPADAEVKAESVETVFKEATVKAAGMALGVVPMGLYLAKLPTAAKVWNPNACREVAAAALPVLDEYSWGKACIKFIEESGSVKMIQLGAVLQPLIMATVEGAFVDIANRKSNQANEVKATGAADVTQN